MRMSRIAAAGGLALGVKGRKGWRWRQRRTWMVTEGSIRRVQRMGSSMMMRRVVRLRRP